MLRSGRLRSEMLQAPVLVWLQRMIGQSTNSVASYKGCALIGLHKTTPQDLTNQNIQHLFSAEKYMIEILLNRFLCIFSYVNV